MVVVNLVSVSVEEGLVAGHALHTPIGGTTARLGSSLRPLETGSTVKVSVVPSEY
jgi:hypothetical protein